MDLNIRSQIFAFNATGMSARSIAKEVGYHHGTVSEELKRNQINGVYKSKEADEISQKRRSKASYRELKITGELKDMIVNLLKKRLSPEQISGRLKLDAVANISHQSIYAFVWADKKAGGELWKFLRHRGKKYNKRKGKTAGRGCIKNRIDISARPKEVEDKARIGDWEMDLVIGQQAANQVLMTAVDRASKYAILRLSPSKKAEDVTAVIIDAFLNLACLVITMTYDNGKEFAYHEDITKALGALCFFATP